MKKTIKLKRLGLEIWQVYFTLLKVMVPAIVIVKILDEFGGTLWLAKLLAPVMQLIGLPESMGIVWASAILTNIYTTMIVFVDVSAPLHLSVAQVSVVGILILLSHSLPIEGAVAKMVGVNWWLTVLLRIGGSLVLAASINGLYDYFDYQQQEAVLLWQGNNGEQSLMSWGVDQLILCFSIFFIIATLIIMLRILRKIGVEALLQRLLSPLLRLLTIGREATNITIIGITLGLSFGAGLLIAEVKKGVLSKRDVLLSVCFLSLAHSLIEDTLLILLLGADIVAVLWLRFFFAVVTIAIMARIIKEPDHFNKPKVEVKN
ncbi:MAG: hypothetical protein V7784_08785 [Oceanospirillaceae bacterium]